jgi:phospho-N-acetylmuramoyl-pentapeptide-transferase
MLYLLFLQFIDEFPTLNVFRYITFRSCLSILTTLIISFLLGKRFILFLQRLQKGGQPIRLDGPQTHLAKNGTPTMGGFMMLISIAISSLLWIDITNPYILIVFFVLFSFAFLGFLDDYLKVTKRNSKGVPGKLKLIFQFMVSILASYWISMLAKEGYQTHLAFPFFKNLLLDLGIFYFLFASIVITGASNAVNLTDGLDGLAIGPIILVCICYALISYLTGNILFAEYLQLSYLPNTGELAVLCATIVGAGLGFLWYNAPPCTNFYG